MNTELARRFLLWCTVVNYAMLIVWFWSFVLAHDALQRLYCAYFPISAEQFDALNYGGMMIYKIGILLFNLVPALVLWLMTRRNRN